MKNILLSLAFVTLTLAQPPPLPVLTNSTYVLADVFGTHQRVTLPGLTIEQVAALRKIADFENQRLGTNRWIWTTYYSQSVLKPVRELNEQLLAGIERQALEIVPQEELQLTPEEKRVIRALREAGGRTP